MTRLSRKTAAVVLGASALAGASTLILNAPSSEAASRPRVVQAPALRGGAPISPRDRIYTR